MDCDADFHRNIHAIDYANLHLDPYVISHANLHPDPYAILDADANVDAHGIPYADSYVDSAAVHSSARSDVARASHVAYGHAFDRWSGPAGWRQPGC